MVVVVVEVVVVMTVVVVVEVVVVMMVVAVVVTVVDSGTTGFCGSRRIDRSRRSSRDGRCSGCRCCRNSVVGVALVAEVAVAGAHKSWLLNRRKKGSRTPFSHTSSLLQASNSGISPSDFRGSKISHPLALCCRLAMCEVEERLICPEPESATCD